jgi:hypothetical protein
LIPRDAAANRRRYGHIHDWGWNLYIAPAYTRGGRPPDFLSAEAAQLVVEKMRYRVIDGLRTPPVLKDVTLSALLTNSGGAWLELNSPSIVNAETGIKEAQATRCVFHSATSLRISHCQSSPLHSTRTVLGPQRASVSLCTLH